MLLCQLQQFISEGKVRYSCAKCRYKRCLDIDTIRYHRYKDDFKPNYWIWTKDREVIAVENLFGMSYVGSSSS